MLKSGDKSSLKQVIEDYMENDDLLKYEGIGEYLIVKFKMDAI